MGPESDAATPPSPLVPPPPPPPLTLSQVQAAGLQAEGRRLADDDPLGRDQRYEALRADLDALGVQVRRRKVPWYRDATALVAVLALLFSFGTTVVSYQKAAQDDIHASEIELRTLIGRLSAIPVEMTEASKAYADDAGTVASLTSVLTQEQLLIAKQAAQVLVNIPEERVTAAQYLLVANVLIANGVDTPGLGLLDRAIARAGDVNDFVSAARVKAYRVFQLGRIDEGRELYQLALGVFSKRGFESTDENFKAYTHLQTRIGWAQGELSIGNCDEARRQIDEARLIAGRFAADDNQVRRMAAVATAIAACRPGATVAPGSPGPGLP